MWIHFYRAVLFCQLSSSCSVILRIGFVFWGLCCVVFCYFEIRELFCLYVGIQSVAYSISFSYLMGPQPVKWTVQILLIFFLPDYLTFYGRDLDNNTTVLSCRYFGISNLFFSPIDMRYTSVCMCVHTRVCVCVQLISKKKVKVKKKLCSLFHPSNIQAYTKRAKRASTSVAHL